MNRMLPTRDTESLRAATANSGGEGSCTRSGTILPPIAAVMRAVRAITENKKPSAYLRERTDMSPRWAKELLRGRAKISGEHLAELLRSDEGLEILEAIMGDTKFNWWKSFKRKVRRENLRRDIKALQREAEEIDDEE
jgi:hypothetical protein